MTSPIQSAAHTLQELYKSGWRDLDEENGGVGWMQDHLDWRRRCLIGDYYLADVEGARTSLEAADSSVAHYRKLEFADSDWLRRQWDRARQQPAMNLVDFLESVRRDGRPRERERELSLAAEHCVYHLAQALDRVAVCVAVVGAFRLDLLETSWGVLAKLAEQDSEQHDGSGPQSAAGMSAQHVMLDLIRTEPARHGPKDWLPWLLRSRQAGARWAPKMALTLMTSYEGGGWNGRLARPFYRQPGWAAEVMMSSPSSATTFDILLQDEPASTLSGLTDSTASLIFTIARELRELWGVRRAAPALLIQPEHQWPRLANQTLLNFPGYGVAPKVEQDAFSTDMAHETAVRLNAARIGDKWVTSWQEDQH